MKILNMNKIPLLWFLTGFGAGMTLISIGQAALPSKSAPRTSEPSGQGKTLLREIKGGKISSPEFEAELSELNRMEKMYVESPDQMERLKNRSKSKGTRVSTSTQRSNSKKGVRK
ncbi:MAG: hypothetical protein KGP28_10835 [Bdellovibrionales bacterium]|nr:hypothetical protein [Bdellovibrionales bacterium]